MKRALVILLAAGVVLAGTWVNVSHRRSLEAARHAAFERAKAERAAELERLRNQPRSAPAPLVLPIATILPSEHRGTGGAPQTNISALVTDASSKTAGDTNLSPETVEAITAIIPSRGKKAWQDPLAREALSFVGFDPEAEEIWVAAINNPDLSPKERQDLIEDLNEDGFADPKNVTADDLPLILSRLALIEEYAPTAMDEVNAAAFMEAYKDLLKMAARFAQQ